MNVIFFAIASWIVTTEFTFRANPIRFAVNVNFFRAIAIQTVTTEFTFRENPIRFAVNVKFFRAIAS
ncbi:MAG: hypothetical protein ACFE0I_01045 [Elainellaceae cyanobacterium]